MPKTLMPYPRLFYGFSLILQLITYLYSPISDSCILCELQVERGVFESILEQRLEVHKAGRNVATSQRHDDESTRIKVNKRQRRDILTSLCQRDFCLSIIKSKMGTRNQGIEERTNEGTESRAATTQISEEETYFCISPFSDKTTDVL